MSKYRGRRRRAENLDLAALAATAFQFKLFPPGSLGSAVTRINRSSQTGRNLSIEIPSAKVPASWDILYLASYYSWTTNSEEACCYGISVLAYRLWWGSMEDRATHWCGLPPKDPLNQAPKTHYYSSPISLVVDLYLEGHPHLHCSLVSFGEIWTFPPEFKFKSPRWALVLAVPSIGNDLLSSVLALCLSCYLYSLRYTLLSQRPAVQVYQHCT